MSTNLQQSMWLEKVAQGIRKPCYRCIKIGDSLFTCENVHGIVYTLPYAETGVGGWLADRPCETCKGTGGDLAETLAGIEELHCPSCHGSGKRGEWPALVWEKLAAPLMSGQTHQLALKRRDTFVEYVNALDLLDAFALMGEAGWTFTWNSANKPPWHAFKHYCGLDADNPGELLNKILVEEEKHG